MQTLTPAQVGETVLNVAVPTRPGPVLPGVRMAGFRGGPGSRLDMRMIPYPEFTLFVDFGDALLVDDASGRRQRGCAVVGLAAGSVRGYAREADCLQIRLSPAVAHAALGASADLGGTLAALDELWGREAGRFQARLIELGLTETSRRNLGRHMWWGAPFFPTRVVTAWYRR